MSPEVTTRTWKSGWVTTHANSPKQASLVRPFAIKNLRAVVNLDDLEFALSDSRSSKTNLVKKLFCVDFHHHDIKKTANQNEEMPQQRLLTERNLWSYTVSLTWRVWNLNSFCTHKPTVQIKRLLYQSKLEANKTLWIAALNTTSHRSADFHVKHVRKNKGMRWYAN